MKTNGFTIVELMITVAIIAILTVVAFPAYTDYVVKARVVEVMAGAKATQVGVEVQMRIEGERNSNLHGATYSAEYLADLIDFSRVSRWVGRDAVAIDDLTGIITLTFENNPSLDSMANTALRMVPHRRGTTVFWECQANVSVSHFELLPLECRNPFSAPQNL